MPPPGRRCLLRALGLAGLTTAAACRRRRTPEEQARALLARLERAVEARDVDQVRDMLARGFRGPEDLNRGEALALLRARLAGRPAIHLLTRILDVHQEGALVRAELLAAMAALPITSADELPRLEAELYRFKLELGDEDGELRVTAASWEPARVFDFE